jgi:hypothetical protein
MYLVIFKKKKEKIIYHISSVIKIQLCPTYKQRGLYNCNWKQSLWRVWIYQTGYQKGVKFDTLVSYLYQVRFITVFSVFRLLTDFICLYNYEFWLSLCKIVRSSVILLLPLFIRSTKMTNNRHAYNRDVLQSYWTSDGLPLYCSQPTGEKTHTTTWKTWYHAYWEWIHFLKTGLE